MENLEQNESKKSEVLILNPELLDKKIEKLKEGGLGALHVAADFDKTLTYAYLGDKKFPSIISLLRDGNHLTPDYAEKAHALFDHYHPTEIDLKIPKEKRMEAMGEWWSKHFQLLIDSGLNKKDLEDIVQSERIKFRSGIKELLENLNENDVPALVISSNGVGDTIQMILEKEGLNFPNIHIITNTFQFDEDGKAIKPNEPTIHSMNKNEIAVKNYPVFDLIKNRKNVLLLGDSIDDLGMVEGFDYENLISIGFLNEEVEKNKDEYLKNFDALVTNDGGAEYVNELMRRILG